MLKNLFKYLFENQNLKQTIVKNTFWVSVSTMLVKLARAGLIIYVARILGAADYGLFTYAMSIVAIFMIFADMGVTSIITRELSRDGADKRAYLSTGFAVKIGFLLFSILGATLIGPLISTFPESKHLILMIAAFVSLESLRSFLYAIPRAEGKMQVEAGIGIVSEIVSTAITLALFFNNPTPSTLAFGYIAGNIVGLLIGFIFLYRHLPNLFTGFRRELIMPIARSSWPLAIMGIFGVFMTHIDAVMLGFWNDSAVLGVYAAAQKPVSLLYIIPSLLSASLLPLMSRMRSDASRLGSFIEKSYRTSLAIGFPIIMGGIVLAGPLLSVAFGPEYAPAILTFQILLVTLIATFPGSVMADAIMAEDKQKIFMKSSGFGGLTNVALNLILIPLFGIAGSAVATVVAQFVAYGILYKKVKDMHQVRLGYGIWKLFGASVVMGGAALLLKSWATPLLVIVPVCIIIYIGMLALMRERLVRDFQESLTTS